MQGKAYILLMIGLSVGLLGCPTSSVPSATTIMSILSPTATPTSTPTPTGTPTLGKMISFANEIQPIFDAICIDCHITGGLANDFVHLTASESFAGLVNQQSRQRPDLNLTLVVPGNSAESLLFQKISLASPPVGSRMPLGQAPLSDEEIALIRDWIDQGAQDN